MPLGSGALAGTTFPVDREYLAQELGFSSISENSLDGVSDRDFIIEFLSIAATLIMHFSRLSEELIIWSSSEFAFIEFDDAYATGSSIMPQKKNPDIAELTRGKTGRIYGHLIQLLTTMKGLPLAYNKDMQEDKEGLFDTVDTLVMILNIFPPMLATIKINKERMEEAAHQGFLNATDLADYLASKGLPFRQAHEVVGRAVLHAIEQEIELEEINLSKWQELFPEIKDYFNTELYDYLNIRQCIEGRKVTGGTAPARTKEVIKKEKKWMGDLYSSSYNDKIDSKYFEE
jgi:argininosuccinate lyase